MRFLLLLLAACATTVPTPVEVRAHLGIPYAHAARWEPAQLVDRPALGKRGPACPQPEEGFHRDTDEDCLNLNVWAPSDARGAPVFVWIHGGAFYQGSGGDDLYDGARLAKRTGMVVVTINYRLGALGFVSFRDRPLPPLGLLDQRVALQWVQRHIAAYGGDPRNVTIAGESAGGWSVCSQLAMPGSRGLFAKAIIMSGACSDALYKSADEAVALGDQLMTAVGCTDAACMAALPVDKLVTALKMRRGLLLLPGVWWSPFVDGVELPKVPLVAIRAGEAAQVPLLLGTARDEGTLHTMFYDAVTPDELAWFVTSTFGDKVDPAQLPHGDTEKATLAMVVNDGIFHCNARRVARLMKTPVFLYQFSHALNGPPNVHALGPTHSIDLFFLFGMPTAGIGPDASEQPLVDRVEDLWAAFARTGDPGHGWPRYDPATDADLELDTTPRVDHGLKRAVCDQWDALSRY